MTGFLIAIAIFIALTAAFAWYLNRQTVEEEPVHRVEHHPFTLIEPEIYDWSETCPYLWDRFDVPRGGAA
jgi:hypothetical protein